MVLTTKDEPVLKKRQGPDPVFRLMRVLQWICSGFIVLVLVLFGMAKPHNVTLWDKWKNVQVAQEWNRELLVTSFYILLILLVLSIVSMYCNFQRMKRKTDEFYVKQVLFLIFAIVGIMLYISAYGLPF